MLKEEIFWQRVWTCGREGSFELDLRETEARDVNWIYLPQDKAQFRALLKAIVNLLFQ